jgi:hypothetical protein
MRYTNCLAAKIICACFSFKLASRFSALSSHADLPLILADDQESANDISVSRSVSMLNLCSSVGGCPLEFVLESEPTPVVGFAPKFGDGGGWSG